MRKHLKEVLEKIVKSSVIDFEGDNSLNPKRVVLYTSIKLRGDVVITVFNYLQNCFYNTQWHIDNPIPVEIIPCYGKGGCGRKKGDYSIDVGACLEKFSIRPEEFLKP